MTPDVIYFSIVLGVHLTTCFLLIRHLVYANADRNERLRRDAELNRKLSSVRSRKPDPIQGESQP